MTDYLPSTRREWLILVVGAGVSLGLQQIPGVTIEPEHATECRTQLAGCQTAVRLIEASKALAWERYRECQSVTD